MQQEGSGAMEKKPFISQSPVQFRNNGVSGERKCDFAAHKNGRSRRHGSNGGSRFADVNQSPRPASNTKWSRSFSDKRPRQRGSFENRQREEVAETEAYDLVLSTGSRKGNANHLLNFKFTPRENEAVGRWGRGHHSDGRRSRGHRNLPRFNKEQFLQASCQFVVREGGEYIEQAVNPDALVGWDMIELIKRFSTEPVTCPICLQSPYAGKITKCGHIYCWACILHYLKLEDDNYRKCPICYDAVMVQDLKSVQLISVPDFSVGDEIEMKLMRKNKGSVQVMPKAEWEDRKGQPMNIEDGSNTTFMKLLVASLQQIQRDVLNQERIALSAHLADAEESEATYIRMAQTLLDEREASLKKVFKNKKRWKKAPSIPGLELTPSPTDSSSEEEVESKQAQPVPSSLTNTLDILPVVVESKPSKVYSDAFEDEIETEVKETSVSTEAKDDTAGDSPSPGPEEIVAASARSLSPTSDEFSERQSDDIESSPKLDPPSTAFPLLSDHAVSMSALSLEETAETLQLPLYSPLPAQQRRSQPEKPKDAYFFYQASTGQHIYLHSLNAHCLTKEYGSLENSPETIKATITSIERCFMTEDVRKRLRYLNHIPLTCEFYVMELKFAPPLVSKETMKFFHAEFEKKRKARLRKLKEEKVRAKRQEVDYRKSFGIYPEVQIPLSNLKQFPSHLTASASAAHQAMGQASDSDLSSQPDSGAERASLASPDSVLESGLQRTDQDQDVIGSKPRSSEAEKSQGGAMSFAEMLKAGKSIPQPSVWGRTEARTRTTSGCSSSSSKEVGNGSDGEDLPAPSYNTSMSDAIEQALNSMEMRRQSSGDQQNTPAVSGGKKKKRKEKQLLFSTAMARKN